MKKIVTISITVINIFSFITLSAQGGDVFVNGYYRKNGSYVQPHFQTAPNSSMFDNYSTKGNFNPYTGKPGWIDPYSKVSSFYYGAIPNNYRSNYEHLFEYLNKKDSYNYFAIVNSFDYQYKLFFTGLFKLNNNETKEANQIFDILRKNRGSSSFISVESNYWFDITSKYLDAMEEFEDLYASSEKYDIDGNFKALKYKLDNVKNPLNFYHKYLIQFDTDWHRHKYLDAISSLDSLIVYSSQTELQDSLIVNYDAIVSNLRNMQNTLYTSLNGTYYYKIETLIKDLRYFFINKKTPRGELREACFEIDKEQCTPDDSVFMRTLNDTAEKSRGINKVDKLQFHTHVDKKYGDSIGVISLRFFDDSSYLIYKDELSRFSKQNNLENSIAYNYKGQEGKIKGFEYLVSAPLIGGLTEEELSGDESKRVKKLYEVYFYFIVNNSGKLTDLSGLFK